MLLTDIGGIGRVRKFKYLGEIVKENGLEKSTVEERIHKMERAYGITKDIYNKKCKSKNAKIRHYSIVEMCIRDRYGEMWTVVDGVW